MKSVIYPTSGDWLDRLAVKFSRSNKPYFQIAWLWFNCNTLESLKGQPFWLYMYHTINSEECESKSGRVFVRIKVVDFSTTNFCPSKNIMNFSDTDDNRTMFFKCETIETIVKESNSKELTLHDFRHHNNLQLHSALRNSMAIVTLKKHIRIKQRIGHSL